MNINYRTFVLFTVLIAFLIAVSCTREIDFTEKITAPKLVINGICALDSMVALEALISKPIHGNMQELTLINDANVFLYVDGVKTEKLVADVNNPGLYKGKTKIEKGRKYAVEAEHAAYGKVHSSETLIGGKISIQNIALRSDSAQTENSERIPDIKCTVKFIDPVDEDNFYRLIVSYRIGRAYKNTDESGNEKISITLIDYHGLSESVESTDPVLLQNKTNDNMVFDESNSKYTLFTDELINGKEYDLEFNLNRSMLYKLADVDTTTGGFYRVIIELQSLSKEVYYYIKSIDGADNITEGLFTEPVQVYSNINDGIGIWGLYTSSVDTIRYGSFPYGGVVNSHLQLPY